MKRHRLFHIVLKYKRRIYIIYCLFRDQLRLNTHQKCNTRKKEKTPDGRTSRWCCPTHFVEFICEPQSGTRNFMVAGVLHKFLLKLFAAPGNAIDAALRSTTSKRHQNVGESFAKVMRARTRARKRFDAWRNFVLSNRERPLRSAALGEASFLFVLEHCCVFACELFMWCADKGA